MIGRPEVHQRAEEVDDRSAVALRHVREDVLDRQEQPPEVHVDDAVEFLPLDVEEGFARPVGGVVHQHVDRAEFPADRLDHRLDVVRVSEVAERDGGVAAGRLDPPGRLLAASASLRAETPTSAPSSASYTAVARPMFRLAPVTSAVRPSKSMPPVAPVHT